MTSRSFDTESVTSRSRPRDPRISIVVPALNEAQNLREVLPALPDVHEVILVDGGSVDGTVEAAREVRPGVVTLTQMRRGKGNALAAGFARVTGDVVVMFDADGSADPTEIPAFVRALLDGADFAKGSRFRPGGGSADITPLRRVGNRFLHTWMNVSFKTDFSDLCYGYNAFWADLIPLLDLPDHELVAPTGAPMLWGDGFEIETLINCRFASAELAITEVPSVELERIHGESNLRTFADGWRVLRTLRTERARLRHHRALDHALLGETPTQH
jgi:glycosyltransferase involved in cell wall biosynthesis